MDLKYVIVVDDYRFVLEISILDWCDQFIGTYGNSWTVEHLDFNTLFETHLKFKNLSDAVYFWLVWM